MNKYEALILTGKLEVCVAGEKELLDEVKLIQKCIIENDLSNMAISLGRLRELSNFSNENVGKHLEDLMRFCCTSNVEIEDNKNMFIEDMNLSVRSYNHIKKLGCNTVADILKYDAERFYNRRYILEKCRDEIIERMEELGFVEWASKIKRMSTIMK